MRCGTLSTLKALKYFDTWSEIQMIKFVLEALRFCCARSGLYSRPQWKKYTLLWVHPILDPKPQSHSDELNFSYSFWIVKIRCCRVRPWHSGRTCVGRRSDSSHKTSRHPSSSACLTHLLFITTEFSRTWSLNDWLFLNFGLIKSRICIAGRHFGNQYRRS